MVLYKKEITMKTKKDLLEAIEDMPMDAPIMKVTIDTKGVFITPVTSIEHDGTTNWITIC
jgi:hypothetical protein